MAAPPGRLLEAMGGVPVRMLSQAAARRNITLVICEADLEPALRRVHTLGQRPTQILLAREGAQAFDGSRAHLRRIGADTRAKYVHFTCAEGYSSSIDMATALHPQTQLTFKYDGDVLPPKYGFPMRVRIPTKLGFKNPKHVIGLVVLNNYTGGYWEDEGYNWFSGL